jgi:hypothetical protein
VYVVVATCPIPIQVLFIAKQPPVILKPFEAVVVPVRLIEKTVVVLLSVDVATEKSVSNPSLAPACIESFAVEEVVPTPTLSDCVVG